MVVMSRFFIASITVLLLILTPVVVFAQDTPSSRIDLTINQGPGLLLPTSPFYFADVFKNNMRLMLASYNSAHKAKVHLQIAGERIAEIKVMIEDKNMPARALDITLASLAENIDGARTELKYEKGKGTNVEKLAAALNDTINSQKESLRILATKTDEEANLKIRANLVKIRNVESEIEDEMATGDLQNEQKQELTQAVTTAVKDASMAASTAKTLQDKLSAVSPKPTVAGVATVSSSKK